MTIEFVKGDLFSSPAQTIVNTVNCKGVMGKGLALQFKKRYPEMFDEYKKACEQGKLRIGVLLPPYKVNKRRWILNFPTKSDWRLKSSIRYIELGLICFTENYKEWGITSIAFPKLGCQHGGLSWKDVKPLMTRHLENLPELKVLIYSYEPQERRKKKAKRKRPGSIETSNTQKKLTFFS